MACHCRFCQRRTGTAFGIEAIFSRQDVEFSGPPPAGYKTTSDESGRWIRLDFCPRCGTNIGAAVERRPDHYVISGGTFDDPNWFEVNMQIWTRSMVKWMVLPEGCEQYERGSTQNNPSVPLPPGHANA
jgi:hypothetical protein